MNILNIIEEIEKTDADIYERLSPRRRVLKSFTAFGSKIALASLPLALGSMFKKAYGQTANSVIDVLQFALTLEYLENEFYQNAFTVNPSLIPAGPAQGAIAAIRDHEKAHVDFLKSTITALGSTPVSKPTFDFSAGNGSGNGPFKDVYTNYDLFLAVAQTFEDTGVRAYKGQAPALVQQNAILEAALNIHSVEARHASHIRQMRKARGADVKPWITGKESGIGAAVQASYDGEENTKQANVEITNINGFEISADAASEAFDEPLTKEQILAIVNPFIV
ncbi:ferritin-like domain-containing protein [Rubrolithibacter danxiaensis]|uniref:ferritin-like domain-containing protein n=1 Tax=Rubrolithibacter danxiaensis TaxID=3390805 RepID=UPI003BF8FF8E